MQVKKQQFKLDTADWFQIEKGVCQGCILSPCLFNLYAEYIMQNSGLEEAQAGIKKLGEISITSDMQMTSLLWQKGKGTKEPLAESERGEWKGWLKAQHSENEDHGIWSHHFLGNRWGNSVRLYFWGLQNHWRW